MDYGRVVIFGAEGVPEPLTERDIMKRLSKRLSALAVAGALIGTGLITGIALPASATDDYVGEVCTPTDAYTETIEHPAVGEPTITVPNPDYKPAIPEIPAIPAEGEPTIVVENEDYEPAVEEVSHIVNHPAVTEVVHHEAETKVVHHEAITKEHAAITHIEYHFAKFTREKTRTWQNGEAIQEVWANFSPNRKNKPFTGPPTWPHDNRGTWQVHNNIPGGHSGPNGVYQKGDGNSSWFYRLNGSVTGGGWGAWSDFGPWTKWSPERHASWQTSDAPLGTPQHHASGKDFYREWQILHDGQTRVIVDKEAWVEVIKPAWDETVVVKDAYDETVVVKEAWDEKVIDVPAKPAVGEPTKSIVNPDYKPAVPGKPAIPAQGEPTIVIDNPEYVPATVEVVEHEAVECPVVPTEPEEPVVTPEEPEAVTPVVPVKTTVTPAPVKNVASADTLAVTGSDSALPLTLGGIALMLAGAGAVLLRKRRTA